MALTREYIVSDGHRAWRYLHIGRDCIVCSDGKLLPVEKLRKEAIRNGHEPIVIFACEPGMPCEEDEFEGGAHGVFSYFWMRVFKGFDDSRTFRQLLRELNDKVWQAGYPQKAEIVCLNELLDVPIDEISKKNSKGATWLMTFDMCRTYSS